LSQFCSLNSDDVKPRVGLGLAWETFLYGFGQFTIDNFWIFDTEIVHFAVRFVVIVYSLEYVFKI